MRIARSLSKKVVTISAIFLVFSALGAFASGNQENPIDTARQLIIQNRLNDAIIVLTDAVRKNPDLIDQAEALMRTIRDRRGEYFTLWEQLINTIQNEPDQPEKALAIIDKMKKLDTAPNASSAQNINEWQDVVQFRANYAKFEKLLTAAADQITQKNYTDAVKTYLSGFSIFQTSFQSANYASDLVIAPTTSAAAQLQTASNNFIAQADRTKTDADAFISALSTAPSGPGPPVSGTPAAASSPGSPSAGATSADSTSVSANSAGAPPGASGSGGSYPSGLAGPFSAYQLDVQRLAALVRQVESAAALLEQVNKEIHLQKPAVDQDWYLTSLAIYAVGPADAKSPQGVTSAVSSLISDLQTPVAAAAGAPARSSFDAAKNAYDAGQLGSASSQFLVAEQYNQLALDAVALWGAQLRPAPNMALSSAGSSLVAKVLPDYLEYQYRAEAAATYRALISLQQANDKISFSANANADTLANQLATVRDLEGKATAGLSQWQTALSAISGPQASYNNPATMDVAKEIASAQSAFLSHLHDNETQIVLKMGQLQLASLQSDLKTETSDSDTAKTYLAGIDETTGEGATAVTVTSHYPDKALPILQRARANTTNSLQKTQNLIQNYSSEPDYITSAKPVQELIASARSLADSLSNLSSTFAQNIDTAQKNIQLAQSLRDEANQSLQNASALLKQNKLDNAISELQNASDLSVKSIQLQADAAYRAQIDKQLAALDQQIKDAKTAQVVELVRTDINDGKNLYQQDQYGEAENKLVQAQQLWETVYPGQQQPEIEYWLRLAQSALNLQNTRELTEVDPLFFTLGNYLNRAKENYAQGKQLLASGKVQQGQQYLTLAQNNIQSVVVARPFNREARVLKLRIQQITDPAGFPAAFKQRFDEAVSREKSDAQSALIDMYDLAAINPNYPGLQDEIAKLEIALGYRPNPVTVAKEQQSNTLVSEAQQLAATGDRAKIELAIGRLEQSLQLNPNNQTAQVLMDRLRISLGSPAVFVLPAAPLEQFNKAQNLFADGKIADALAIVEKLWQNTANQGYAPLVDLRRTILSRLGQ